MGSFTLVTVFGLCSLSWISASETKFHTAKVQSGEQVTLLCSNFSTATTISWFRAVEEQKPRCVCSMSKSSEPASYCDGFNNLTFEASSNMSTLFLKIKRVRLSDSGLYFCGMNINTNSVFPDATYLEVQDFFEGNLKLISLIFAAVTLFFTVLVFGLIVVIVKIKGRKKAHIEEPNPVMSESHSSDDFEYPPDALVARQEGSIKEALQTDLETARVNTDTT